MRYMPSKKTLPSIVALVLVVNVITCASASMLKQSIAFLSTGTITYSSSFKIVVQVGASQDDAGAWWDWSGYYWPWTLDKSHVSVGGFTDGSQYNGGLRFASVNIPQEAKIVAAVLKVCADQTCAGTGARWNICGEYVGDSASFSTKQDFDARPTTVSVKDTGFFTGWIEGTWYQIDGLTSIIQETVNRSDWKSGNALALLLFGHADARTTHEIRSYDANPSQAAMIEVVYEIVG